MGKIPKQYEWLTLEKAPKVLVEAVKHIGLLEVSGPKSNPDILKWAKELNLGNVYTTDSIAWCGLFVALCVKRAGYEVVKDPLWALNWNNFGVKVTAPMLGDIITFVRPGGGHVGFYIGEDKDCYHILGGNQSDSVSITRILKSRAKGFRRSPFKVGQPAEVRKIELSAKGEVSTNEA